MRTETNAQRDARIIEQIRLTRASMLRQAEMCSQCHFCDAELGKKSKECNQCINVFVEEEYKNACASNNRDAAHRVLAAFNHALKMDK